MNTLTPRPPDQVRHRTKVLRRRPSVIEVDAINEFGGVDALMRRGVGNDGWFITVSTTPRTLSSHLHQWIYNGCW